MVGVTSQAFLAVELTAGLLFVSWAYSGRSDWMRRMIRRSYVLAPRGVYPYGVYFMVVAAPLWAPLIAAFGVSLLLPRQVATWALMPLIAWGIVVFALAYRVPPPLLPTWLRAEIAEGRTPESRPGRWDKGCLWAIIALGLLLIAFVPVLVLVYHEGS